MGFSTPIMAWFLLLTLPIIALYLLKPKSQSKIVASTFLWKKTISALDSEKLHKKLIKNWLFYLQLAIIILGVLFLMKPFNQNHRLESQDIIIFIDTSASMSTSTEGLSRLEEVKTSAKDLIKSLKGKPTISLYSIESELIQSFKGASKSNAIAALDKIEVTKKSLNKQLLEKSIDSFARESSSQDIIIFSDHRIVEEEEIQYFLSTRGQNKMRILKAVYRESDKGAYLQVLLENLSDEDLVDELLIYGDDTLLKIEGVELGANQKTSLNYKLDKSYRTYTMGLKNDDDYTLDNHYYLPVDVTSVKKILFQGNSNKFLEQSLLILPNVELFRAEDLSINTGYDLYVYNGLLPENLPTSGSLLIINPSETNYLSLGDVESNGQLSFDRTDAIWRHVNLNFGIRSVQTIETTIGKDILSLNDKSVISKGKLDDKPAVVIGFDLLDSDFPIRTGFPVFMYNTASYLLGSLSHDITQGIVGTPLQLLGDPNATSRSLLSLDGDEEVVDDTYPLSIRTSSEGLYLLKEYDEEDLVKERWIAFNVTRDESVNNLVMVSEEALLSNKALKYQSFEWLIAVILLLVLIIEWWVYYHGY